MMKTGQSSKGRKKMHWLYKLLPVAFITMLACNNALSQKLTATLDRDKIVIGEQVTLQLKITDVNPRTTFIATWFTLPDSANHISFTKKDALDTVDINGLSTYFQHVTITSFDSGRWAVPLQPVVLQDRETGKQVTIKPDSVILQVLPVDVSALKDYHDIKDIIDVPAENDYTLVIAAAISVVVIIVLVILIARRKKKPVQIVKKPAKNARTPIDEALFKLDELEKEGLPFRDKSKIFFIRVDDICREYFTNRVHIDALQLTSDELLPALAIYVQDKQARAVFSGLLRLIDAAKFAKFTPTLEEHSEAIKAATNTLQHIERQIKITMGHAN